MSENTKVTCINGLFGFKAAKYNLNLPKEGNKYTIRKVVASKNGLGVLLNEIVNDNNNLVNWNSNSEPTFKLERFQPDSELTVDVANAESLETENQ